ncbi:DUF3131 domain-containing protein [Paracoccus sp. 1_MG-2023]|uniref:DUF3131 domain-containing protein n=1 Tax=unclassified Paracoccus (in: a-proteobacteria) TaxID=2688777 RepID=UPI001C088B48|nr:MULTISPECIES: DUF3131 domain-containing protein [unclassified Paracoccus (in: a-proteobacteria)]MBU2958859.1 DUF3131 domain-containing protein [Paracoccus sp. C2R09]MDO6670010.1 DUF3131 domain-containing protein [Paracoccus sp. 1_MG-2023]
MSFRDNLSRARGHIVMILALILGLLLVMWLETLGEPEPIAGNGPDVMQPFLDLEPLPLAIRGESSERDLEHAEIAWTYFRNNVNDKTGLANSVHNYPSTTMWETGSYLVAILSAERLGLIEDAEAQDRIARVLNSLSKLRLFQDLLPNKAYHTGTLQLVNYANQPVELGLGWSALDIARIVGTLGLVERNHPDLAPEVEALLGRWRLDRMVKDGELIGTNVTNDDIRENQEGRVGYEQYAAKAMMSFGFDVYRAYDVAGDLMVKQVEGHPIPVDTRLHRASTPAFVVSEPYLFDGLEFGFDDRSRRFATAIYRAQEARHADTGKLTAVTESHLSEAPYFAYSTIWGGGAPWAVMTFQGERIDSRRTMATKAAFGWDALFGTEYTAQLVDAVEGFADPEKGWPEGIYEETGEVNGSTTANTNAVVLAALAFKATGPLTRVAP